MDEELESQGRKMGMVYQVYMQTDRSKTKAQVEEAVAGGVQYVFLFSLLLFPHLFRLNETGSELIPGPSS
jgi:hypothetical protein